MSLWSHRPLKLTDLPITSKQKSHAPSDVMLRMLFQWQHISLGNFTVDTAVSSFHVLLKTYIFQHDIKIYIIYQNKC